MISSEILMIVDAVSREKNLDKEIIFQAVESALATAMRKHHTRGGEALEYGVRVSVHRDTGEYDTYRQWEVLSDEDEIEFPQRQLHVTEARARKDDVALGDFVEEQMEEVSFGRIATQAAKQIIVQKVREAEREQTVQEFIPRKGTMVSGVVKRLDRGDVIVDVGGGAEALLHKSVMIPREGLRPGDRIRAILEDVRSMPRGPQLFLNRITPQLLIDLFKLEVPEAGDGLIEIRGAARDPGLRAKIAVHSNDKRVDPVGACVGIRGSRVQSVSNEIAGERVDIVKWSDDFAQFVIQALTPAEIESILVDEEKNSVDIVVDEVQLSQAIGRNGQNVRLASELSGWHINIMTDEEATQKAEAEQVENRNRLMTLLDIDEDVAGILVQEGYATLDDVVESSREELLKIDAFDAELADEVRRRAVDALIAQTVTEEDKDASQGPSRELLAMEFMDEATAWQLAGKGIVNMDDLADFATDELLELLPALGEERARTLIMTARAPWFEEQSEQAAEQAAETPAEPSAGSTAGQSAGPSQKPAVPAVGAKG